MATVIIFITRKLKLNSPFKKGLSDLDCQIIDQSLIQFIAIPFDHVSDCDWIFFYSKNGVRFFFEQLKAQSKRVSSNIKLAAMGLGTARAIESYRYKADFTGNGQPAKVALQFLPFAKEKTILFVRAQSSIQSVQNLLSNQVEIVDFPVYHNLPISNPVLPNADILVFTSPMNVNTYFDSKPYSPDQKVIAIGATTARALKNQGIENIILPETPTEAGLAKVAIALVQQLNQKDN